MAVARAWDEADRFDLIHSHVETQGFQLAAHGPVPVVTTLHGRLDVAGATQYIDAMPSIPLIAISDSQRRWNPDANWLATIHHGIDFTTTPTGTRPGDDLLFVGRITREKGVDYAIELARRTRRRLVIAAKAHEREEEELFELVVRPAIDEGVVDWRGEVDSATRDQLMVRALATVMLGAWPELFGLVAIESMATGTPVIAETSRRPDRDDRSRCHRVPRRRHRRGGTCRDTRCRARPWRDRQQDARALLGRPDGRCV